MAAVPGTTLDELRLLFESDAGSMHGKLNAFPTEDDYWVHPETDPAAVERPLLIDPTREDPSAHLEWKLEGDIPILVPRCNEAGNASAKGQTSIEVYGLNRFGLAQSRRAVLLLMEGIGKGITLAIDAIDDLDEAQKQRQLALIDHFLVVLGDFTVKGRPYASMALAYIRQLRASLERKLTRIGALSLGGS